MSATSAEWLTADELINRLSISAGELRWYQREFRAQLRVLTQQGPDGAELFSADALRLLQSLTAMVGQGATPEQIKGWFGLH